MDCQLYKVVFAPLAGIEFCAYSERGKNLFLCVFKLRGENVVYRSIDVGTFTAVIPLIPLSSSFVFVLPTRVLEHLSNEPSLKGEIIDFFKNISLFYFTLSKSSVRPSVRVLCLWLTLRRSPPRQRIPLRAPSKGWCSPRRLRSRWGTRSEKPNQRVWKHYFFWGEMGGVRETTITGASTHIQTGFVTESLMPQLGFSLRCLRSISSETLSPKKSQNSDFTF